MSLKQQLTSLKKCYYNKKLEAIELNNGQSGFDSFSQEMILAFNESSLCYDGFNLLAGSEKADAYHKANNDILDVFNCTDEHFDPIKCFNIAGEISPILINYIFE